MTMAANYIKGDPTKEVFRNIVRGGQMLREAVNLLAQQRAVILQMRDGDGSSAAHYDVFATAGGFSASDYADANAAAKASFDELDALLAKVNTDGNVAFVRAAIDQFCAKHGV